MKSQPEPELLTIAELAARWRIPEKVARRVVQTRGVPFVQLSQSDLRLVWDRVRFDLEAVKSWERSQQRAWEPPIAEKSAPVRAGSGKRLGDWR